MLIVDALKRQLHRDIVADPVVHAAVLNLYLNGEYFPRRVATYFPSSGVDDPALAAKMDAHLRDEDRHVALYTKAIGKLGQPVVEQPADEVFNEVILSRTGVDFTFRPADTPAERVRKLGHFFAHLHFLEKRVVRSLEYHAEACAHSASPYVAKVVPAILADEVRHVEYTREAVRSLLPERAAKTVLEVHRRGEAKANLDFSARQLGRLVREQATRFPARKRLVYLGCAKAMQAMVDA
jgi:hypothetical protein